MLSFTFSVNDRVLGELNKYEQVIEVCFTGGVVFISVNRLLVVSVINIIIMTFKYCIETKRLCVF